MHHPTIIDIGTDEDAGFWLAALSFVHFEAREHTGGDGAELLAITAPVFGPFHPEGDSHAS